MLKLLTLSIFPRFDEVDFRAVQSLICVTRSNQRCQKQGLQKCQKTTTFQSLLLTKVFLNKKENWVVE